MSQFSRIKFRSAGVGAAMLAGIFLASTTGAQEQPSESAEHEQSAIRMTLPNLTTHPLAGGTIMHRLCPEDGMAQRSCDEIEVYIPPPTLENPIGQILHGLRRNLAEDDLMVAPDVVATMQNILDTQAENFDNPESLTRLSEIQQDLVAGIETQDLDVLDKVVQDLWRLILQLENDLRSEAERALEEALEALREALENGASEEELRELREQAQEALEDFLEEQLENAEENEMSPEEQAALEEMAALMEAMQEMMEEMGLSEEMMAEMMEQKIEQALEAQQGQSQSGEAGEQQEMDYQQMLEQMQQQMQQMQEMMENMDELQELIDDQQELRDDTFSEALEEEEPADEQDPSGEPEQTEAGQEGQPEEEQEQQGQEGLSERQGDLSERLQELMDRMRSQGMDPGELQQAQEAMQRAIEDLNNGEEGQALRDQDEVLETLKSAQQQMQQQMQQMMQGGGGPQSGQGPGGPAGSRQLEVPGVDNDGRISEASNPNDILDVSPGEGSEAQRGVRDQIRRRIEEGGSPYLESLLDGDQGPSAP